MSRTKHPEFERHGRISLRTLLASAACVTALGGLALVPRSVGDGHPAGTAPNPPGIPDTTSGIHIAQVFNFNIHPATAERGVDFVWGSQYPSGPGRTYNTYYVTFDSDSTGSSPNVSVESTAWFTAHMPTAVEYACDRVTPAYESTSDSLTPLDIADPAVQQWQWTLEVLPGLAGGWPGIAFDNLALANGASGPPRCGHYDSNGQWVSQYSGKLYDAAYISDVIAWARQMRARIHAFKAADTFVGNFSYDTGLPAASNLALMELFDVIFDERGFSEWGERSYPTLSEWTAIVHAIDVVQAAGGVTSRRTSSRGLRPG